MTRYPVDDKLRDFSSVFSRNGFSIYLVGGAVRDFLLKKENHDYDFTTDAEPMEVKRLFRHTIDTGIKHGTVTVLFRGESYEVTSFRTESGYSDSRHPEKVEFVKSLSEDLKRRDFTINAIAAALPSGKIIDEHEGLKDLKKRTIRAIGNPYERFNEDALRMLRACRFAAKLSFDMEEETFEAIRTLRENVKAVSAERIKEEIFSLILSDNPVNGLEYMRLTGLMEILLPELYATYGVEQGGIHGDDVYHHLLKTLYRAKENGHDWKVRIAALFHDIGKVETRRKGEEREYTFFGHDTKSAEMYEKIADRLKTSNEEKYSVSHLIRNHMFSYSPSWSDAAVRRFMKRVGKENIDDLLDLRVDDAEAISGKVNPLMLIALVERINGEIEKDAALSLKDLRIKGDDLIREKIINPSPLMGRILNTLLDEVIEDPTLNEREKLLKRATELAREL